MYDRQCRLNTEFTLAHDLVQYVSKYEPAVENGKGVQLVLDGIFERSRGTSQFLLSKMGWSPDSQIKLCNIRDDKEPSNSLTNELRTGFATGDDDTNKFTIIAI